MSKKGKRSTYIAGEAGAELALSLPATWSDMDCARPLRPWAKSRNFGSTPRIMRNLPQKADGSMKWSSLGWKGNELSCCFGDQSGLLDPLAQVQGLQSFLTPVRCLFFFYQ